MEVCNYARLRAGDSLSRVFVTSAVVLTDFGAESSFGKAVERAKEHHRIQEARLALARMPDSVTARFGVTMGVANDMGNQLTACVVRLVGSSKTRFIVLAMEQVGWWNKSSVASARKGTI